MRRLKVSVLIQCLVLCRVLFISEGLYAVDCSGLLSKLSVEVRINELYSEDFAAQLIEELEPEVRTLIDDDSPLSGNVIEDIFHLYMARRIQYLPEKVQSQVNSVLESGFRFKILETEASQPPPFEAYSHRELYMVFLVLPAAIHKTALDYFIRVHELEHIIQYYTVGKKVLSELHPTQHLNHFYFERGAMRSEAAFLKLFPQKYLVRVLEQWKATPHQPGGLADDVFESVIAHTLDSQTVGEYVNLQWEHGRYAKKTFLQRHWGAHLRFWSSTFALSSPLWLKLLGIY